MTLKLSTLSILLGLGMGLPQIYGMLKPAAFAAAVRKFPRSLPWGVALMVLGTVWFLWNLSQESIADFASYKNVLFAGFAGVGLGTCIFVQDFLAVRGLAIVLLLLAKLMVDTGRPGAAANALGAGHSNVGVCPGGGRHLVHGLAVAAAGFPGLGHGNRTADQGRLRASVGVRLVRGGPGADRIPVGDVSAQSPRRGVGLNASAQLESGC